MFEIRVNSEKFPNATVGSVVRVRSVVLSDLKKDNCLVLETQMQTNILSFQPYMLIYKEITEYVFDEHLMHFLINQE